ncbi:MAG TPA: GNAT family protein [Symbiobacteriaceae bacterium]|nr:GNAT family protein [Symbiobacteriaceae bacterium]
MQGVIWGEKVGIRPLSPFDAGAIRRFMTDPAVVDLLFEEKGGEPPSALLLALMIISQGMGASPDYGIVEKNGTLIGSVRLWRVSERNRSAMLTIFIGEKRAWGSGYGTDAMRLILRQAFGPMKLHRVELNVFDFNERAIRCYERVGFTREGIRREALCRDGRYHDILVMGILREEFLAREAERFRRGAGEQ